MRTGIPNLPTPHPLGERMPAVYLDDDFTQRLVGALDSVLAPVLVTLDSFPAYLDPRLAPEDFLSWLAGWVALAVDESWPVQLRRELVANAVQLHRWRGTRQGLARQVQLLAASEVEVSDSGACTWSDQPGAPVPGTAPPHVAVRVRAADPQSVDTARLRAAVAELVPAHVRVTVDVTAAGPPSSSAEGANQ